MSVRAACYAVLSCPWRCGGWSSRSSSAGRLRLVLPASSRRKRSRGSRSTTCGAECGDPSSTCGQPATTWIPASTTHARRGAGACRRAGGGRGASGFRRIGSEVQSDCWRSTACRTAWILWCTSATARTGASRSHRRPGGSPGGAVWCTSSGASPSPGARPGSSTGSCTHSGFTANASR